LRLRATSETQEDVSAILRRRELAKGCRTVLAELAGLDFSKLEAQRYLQAAVKPPIKYKDFSVGQVEQALQQLVSGQEEQADEQALTVLNAMLSDVWRWRRRGGGADEDGLPHEQALEALQGVTDTPAAARAEADAVSSSLLDNLNITDAEKKEVGRAMQTVFVTSIQGAIWGSIVMTVLGIGLLNFLRGGG